MPSRSLRGAARLMKLRVLNVVRLVTQLRFGVGTPTLTASSAEQTHLGNQTYCWLTSGPR